LQDAAEFSRRYFSPAVPRTRCTTKAIVLDRSLTSSRSFFLQLPPDARRNAMIYWLAHSLLKVGATCANPGAALKEIVMFVKAILKTTLGAAAAACLMFSTAQAAPISNASFGFTGAFDPAAGTHLGTTTGIFVGNGGLITITEPGQYDLAGALTLGTTGTMSDIPSFSSFAPIDNFFTIGGVSFDLNTFTVHSQTGPIPGFINATGGGMLSAPGFDDTAASITFTGTSVNNLAFTFGVTAGATSQPDSVPEPFSLGLLGLGLLGAYAGRRKLATKSA